MEIREESKTNSLLSFRVGTEIFAAEVEKVLHILELPRITHVPACPDYMLGVINLRGSVLPVIDSRYRFGLAAAEDTRNTCIVVMEVLLEGEDIKIGLKVDAVLEVIEMNTGHMQAPPSIGQRFKTEFIKGIVQHGNDFVMVLNLDKLFSSDELLVVKDASSDNTIENE